MLNPKRLIFLIMILAAPSSVLADNPNAFPVGFKNSVKYSRHNLSALNLILPDNTNEMEGRAYNKYGEICVYCHTPHNSSQLKEGPLWNRQTPMANYSVYRSSSMDAQVRQPQGISLACLSCHDGTIAVDSLLNKPNLVDSRDIIYATSFRMDRSGTNACGGSSGCHSAGGSRDHASRYLETNLRNDHPVSINYSEAYAAQNPPEFRDPTAIAPLRLFNGRVECASCHDVHKPTNPFTYNYPAPSAIQTTRSFHLRRSNGTSNLCMTCHVK